MVMLGDMSDIDELWRRLGSLLGMESATADDMALAARDAESFYSKFEEDLYREGYDPTLIPLEAMRYLLLPSRRVIQLDWKDDASETYGWLEKHPLVKAAGLTFDHSAEGQPNTLMYEILDELEASDLELLRLTFDSDSYEFVVVPAADLVATLEVSAAIGSASAQEPPVNRYRDNPEW